MNYGILLGSGSGNRFGGKTPKQFLKLGNKSVISYSIDAFFASENIDKIILVLDSNWINFKFEKVYENLIIISGGNNRMESLHNAIKYIYENFELNSDDVAITHDVARPFIKEDFIEKTINMPEDVYASTVVVPLKDTIIMGKEGVLKDMPSRSDLFSVQTPQSFKIMKFIELIAKVKEEDFIDYTDACRIFYQSNNKVSYVLGDYSNIKITTPEDLVIAENILERDFL